MEDTDRSTPSPAQAKIWTILIIAIVASTIACCVLTTTLLYIRARVKAKEYQRIRDDVEKDRLVPKIRESLSQREHSSISEAENFPVFGIQQ